MYNFYNCKMKMCVFCFKSFALFCLRKSLKISTQGKVFYQQHFQASLPERAKFRRHTKFVLAKISPIEVKNTKCFKIKQTDNFFRYDLLKKSWCF